MAFTQYTNLDFSQIRTSIKDYLRANTTFSDFDFEGSNFSVLIDVLAYNTYLTAFNTNMVINETFLDSATIRENVVSLVRNIGYVPLSRRSAKAKISFSLFNLNTNIKTVSLKRGIVCTGDLDNTSYIFSIPDDITVGVSNQEATFSEIEIYEGTLLSKSFTVDYSQPNQKFILPNPYIDTSTIRVTVKETEQSTVSEEFTAVDNIINIDSNSNIFLVQEISDEKYEIIFGDGIFGKKLENNNYIQVTYITTNGKLGNGASNFTFSGIITSDLNTRVDQNSGIIITDSAAANGDDIQSLESIKYYAPRLYASQYRTVSANDYESLIPSLYPNIESITAYGGEEMTPPEYGKVFIAAKPKNADYLSEVDKQFLLRSLKKYTVAGIEINFVDINVVYVELDSVVYYNSNFVGSTDSLKTKILSSLETYSNSSDLNKFGGRFKYSKCLSAIDNTSNSITSNITKVKIRRNVEALINYPTQYRICFENEFSSILPEHNIRSSGFTVSGINSIVYIGDSVKSSTEGSLFLFSYNKSNVISEISDIGTVNYTTGEINIDNINVLSTVLSNNIIEIEATPASNDIVAKKSIYLKLDVGKSILNLVKDTIASGENSSGSVFVPEQSFLSRNIVRI